MKYKVIDNFLDEEYFNSLAELFVEGVKVGRKIPWFFEPNVAYPQEHKKWKPKEKDDNFFYMNHLMYTRNAPVSVHFQDILPLLDKIGTMCLFYSLIRITANLFPNTHTLHEHPMHEDYEFSHSAALFSLNTCDGYTKLKDGTKIDSVANRILLFDASELHCSTTTTNVPARFNININYITIPKLKGSYDIKN